MGTIDIRKLFFFLTLTVSATAHAAITGRVVDDDVHPIAGAAIRAYDAESSAAMRARLIAGKLERAVVASTQSAQDGSFSIDVKGHSAVDVTIETEEFRIFDQVRPLLVTPRVIVPVIAFEVTIPIPVWETCSSKAVQINELQNTTE